MAEEQFVVGVRGLGLVGPKKGAKKGGGKTGAKKSPAKVVRQAVLYVSFKNDAPLKPYITVAAPGEDVKGIHTHETLLKTFKHPTATRIIALLF
eukprot:g50407.t1